ncbi:MAG: glycosyltransferase family 39 protein [Candidatus Sumerlaeia bacterium]|nr:glycosyltransferase family 39 protein [Candidatus Sumerlaeia bacterium]
MSSQSRWVLPALIVLAAAIRFPQLFDPVFQDEWVPFVNLQHFYETRWLAPAVPEWPPLHSYLMVPVIGITLVLGGFLTGLDAMEYAIIASAFLDVELVYGTRFLSLLCSLAVLPLLWYALPRHVGNVPRVAACLLWIFSPVSVEYGAYGLPETGLAVAVAGCVLLALRYLETGAGRDLVWAGVCAGVAAAFKYNGGMVCVAVAMAAMLGPGGWRVGWRHLLVAGLASLGCFLLLTPTILLDTRNTIDGLLFERDHLSTPRIGPNYLPWVGTPWFFLTREPGWLFSAFLGSAVFILGLGSRKRLAVILAAVLVNYLIVGGWARMDPNYWIPSLPAASLLLGEVIRSLAARHQFHVTLVAGGLLAMSLLVLFPPDPRTSNYTRMSEWLAENLPTNVTITRDGSYTPKVWTMARLHEFHEGPGARLSLEGEAHFVWRIGNSPRALEEVILVDVLRREELVADLHEVIPAGSWLLISSLPRDRVMLYPPPGREDQDAIHTVRLNFYEAVMDPDGPWELIHAETEGAGQQHFVYRHANWKVGL